MIPLVFKVIVLVVFLQTVAGDGHCRTGDALPGHYCGRGGSRCPEYYVCNTSPIDAFAVCCPSKCPRGSPLLGLTGLPLHCGSGGGCPPDLYTCIKAPTDAYGVCCLK